jgi:hypothetical protein
VKDAVVFFLIVFLTACSNRTSIPKNIIPPDSMQKIMMDVMRAQQYADQYISKDTLKRDKTKADQELLENIFKIHRVTRKSFTESLHFYESRPDLNKMIFDSLAVYVNNHRPELYLPKSGVKPVVNPVIKPMIKPNKNHHLLPPR